MTINVLANDTDSNNDPLSVTGATDGVSGATNVNLDNTVTYTPNPNFTGSDSFTYDIDDGKGGTDGATVTVTVNAVGEAPVVSACMPTSGKQNEKLPVTIEGSNFASGATVSFGSRIAVQDVTFVDNTKLNVLIKIQRRASTGPRDVTVTNPDNKSDTKVDCFVVS